MFINLKPIFRYNLFEKEQIAWENGTNTVGDIYICCRHLGFTQTKGFYPKLSFQYL